MRTFVCSLVASIALLAAVGRPAAAATIHVHNATAHTVIVTVYSAWDTKGWREVTLNGQGRQVLKAGAWWPFFLPADPNVRVRGEVQTQATGYSYTSADVHAVRSGLARDGSYVAKIEKNGTGYHVVIYR